jgi:putative NADPH-quinone reductase
MKVLLVVAHPCHDSYTQACAMAATRGLTSAGHEVDTIDLAAESFRPDMSREERVAYESDQPILDPMVADHAQRLLAADAIVFVYPTWWSGLPAVLKGWLERVMVPGVGFTLDARTNKVRPGLTHVERIVGISTYGSPWHYVKLTNDNGRRILTRALRMSCGWRTRTTWLALYALDTVDDEHRNRHLDHIESRLAAL